MKPISVQDWKREGYAKKKRSHEGVHTYTGLRIAAVEHGFSRFFFTYRSHHCILVCDSWVHRLFLSLLMSPSWKDIVLIMCESLFHLDPSISPCHIKSTMNFLFIQMVWTSSLLLFKIKSIRWMFFVVNPQDNIHRTNNHVLFTWIQWWLFVVDIFFRQLEILVFRCQGIVIIQTRLISTINCWNGQ